MNQIHSALGEQEGLAKAFDPATIFATHEMLELPKEEE